MSLPKLNASSPHILVENCKVPYAVFKTRIADESVEGPNKFKWHDTNSEDWFAKKNVVLFSLPGAFTPTCSTTHLPEYEENYEEFKALGVDQIVCLSVNDAFVMYQWGLGQKAKNVKLLPDGNGDFTRLMGMLVKKENLGFGMRSWRYSMYVENGTIKKMFAEPGFSDNCHSDPFEVSDAGTMLRYLKNLKK